MANGFNPYLTMLHIAKRGLSNQVVRPGDYKDPSGLLVCGKCGEKRQRYVKAPKPTPDDPNAMADLLVVCDCRCDREKEAAEKREKAVKEAREKVQRLKSMSLMDDKFQTARFKNFQQNNYNEKNLKMCKKYAQEFHKMLDANQGLLLWGDVGTGKSFAAACIANYLIEHGVSTVMTSFVKILDAVQCGSRAEDDIIAKLNSAKLVVFDDLGAERSTEYALERVYNLIDSRYRRRLPMILTTNLTINDMKNEQDMRYRRIYDRIFETCYPIQFTGPSWRRIEANKRFVEMGRLLGDN